MRQGTSRFHFVPVCRKLEQNGTLMGAGPGALPSAFICAICGSFPAGRAGGGPGAFKVQRFKVQRFKVQRFKVQRFKVQRFKVQRFKVQRFKVQRFKVQRFKVQGSTVQRFKVQAFKGPLSSRLPCSKVVTGCNSVVSVISCEFSGIMGSSFLSIKKSKPGHGRSRRPFRGWLSGRLWKGGQPGPALQRRWRFCRNGLANG